MLTEKVVTARAGEVERPEGSHFPEIVFMNGPGLSNVIKCLSMVAQYLTKVYTGSDDSDE